MRAAFWRISFTIFWRFLYEKIPARCHRSPAFRRRFRRNPAEVFLPEKVTFVEGEDDGDGAVDVTVATDAKVADIVSFLQAKAKEQGLQAISEEVNEEDAKLEYSKVGADNNGEYKVEYTILTEDGKRHIEVLFLDSRK